MDQERTLRELTEFLRIPSISTLPAHDADCRRAAEWVANDLRRLGCRDVQLLGSDTHPVVWGVGPEVPGAPTLLIYGHYDVQPPDPLNEWTSPPFEPSVRDGRVYARGAADDKGQVFCLLRAIEALGDSARELPIPDRRRGRVRQQGAVRSAAARAGAHPGGRRAGRRHVVPRTGMARRVHVAARHVLRRNRRPHREARSAFR